MPETVEEKRARQAYAQELARKETSQAEDNMFKMDNFGGEKEVHELIKRYERRTTLSEEDRKVLLKNAPPSLPKGFQPLSHNQYQGKGCWKQSRYKSNVKSYFSAREKYYKQKGKKGALSPGELFARKRMEIESRFKEEKDRFLMVGSEEDSAVIQRHAQKEFDETLEAYRKDGLFGDIEEDSETMDKAFENRIKNEKQSEAEAKLAQKHIELMKINNPGFMPAIKNYTFDGYTKANQTLREGGNFKHLFHYYLGTIEKMKSHPIKHDMIVRRAVKELKVMGEMMGLSDLDSISADELKKKLKEKFDNSSEMIVTEKGFMSTSMPDAGRFFPAGDEYGIGIEFVILVKKGTPAVNVSKISTKPEEGELLIAPGTKFKVVDMQLDGEGTITCGNEKSWKIYLASVPTSQDGILKEA